MTPTILPDWTDGDRTETLSGDVDPDTGHLMLTSEMPEISTHHFTIPAGALPWLRGVLAKMETV